MAVALVASACGTGSDDRPDEASVGASESPGASGVPGDGLVVVLPPADGLADAERTRIRRRVEDVVARATGDGAGSVLEPATAASLADALDIAARRAGGDGTVCLLGARGRAALTAVLVRYPGVRACVVPGPLPSGVATERVAVEDVDLGALGRSLGLAAREAAGPGAVLLLDGGDALLDVRLRRGVEEGVLGVAGASGPTFGVVGTAAAVVALLDEQAAIREEGGVPGGSGGGPDDGIVGMPEGGDGPPGIGSAPTARSLRSVAVVILDAGPEAASLAPSLAERGVRVVLPTALLDAGLVPLEQVVLHWSVRWDVSLASALARSSGATDLTGSPDPVVLVQGPAGAVP